MIKEFKDFINKGGVFEAAVGLILALAFMPVVTSLVDDILMPIVGRIFGQPDFSALEWKIGGQECTPNPDGGADICTEAAIRYGAWINTIVAFVLISLVVFVLVKMYNSRVSAPEDAGPSDNELLTEIRDSLQK